jgi:DNA-binding HxlR family transcriptional regulator
MNRSRAPPNPYKEVVNGLIVAKRVLPKTGARIEKWRHLRTDGDSGVLRSTAIRLAASRVRITPKVRPTYRAPKLIACNVIPLISYFAVCFVEYKRKKFSNLMNQPSAYQIVENVVGWKWSLTVLSLIRKGVCRPGEMGLAVEGLSSKMLHERLGKLVRLGVLEKTNFPELPPRVEYRLSTFGHHFGKLLDEVERLEQVLESCRANRANS